MGDVKALAQSEAESNWNDIIDQCKENSYVPRSIQAIEAFLGKRVMFRGTIESVSKDGFLVLGCRNQEDLVLPCDSNNSFTVWVNGSLGSILKVRIAKVTGIIESYNKISKRLNVRAEEVIAEQVE